MPTESLPPGPDMASIRQSYNLLRRPLEFVTDCASRYGDIFTLRLAGFGSVVYVSSPADLKLMFAADPEISYSGEASFALFGPIVGRGTLFTMDGSAHLRRRRLLLPPFHGERMQDYATLMRDITEKTIAGWPLNERFSLYGDMQQITLLVILRAVFGLGEGPVADRLARLLGELAYVAMNSKLLLVPFLQIDLGRHSPWGKITRLLREVHALLDAEIASRRADPIAATRTDVLSLLLQATDEEGKPLTDEELRDELTMMLLAGHETTATTLSWAFESILSSPDVLEKIRAELAEVTGGEPIHRDHLKRLDYLDATIKEGMRLRPIMPTAGARKLKGPLALTRHTLPAGVLVANCEYLLHRNAEIYPQPETFRPERFLGKKIDPYQWTPFGGGIRRCMGMAFALYEMKVVIATILQRTRLTLTESVQVGRRGYFLVPSNDTKVVVSGRTPPTTRIASQEDGPPMSPHVDVLAKEVLQ